MDSDAMRWALEDALREMETAASEQQLQQFVRYFELLIEWNGRMNLTAITSPAEVAQKHFADSLQSLKYIPQGAACIDVGTGAGLPGIPLCIMRPDIRMTLLDSQNKRVTFLREVCEQLGIKAATLHQRAEDAANTPLRGSFSVALSRAVAPTPVLMEYTLPFCAIGGLSIAYKGRDIEEEIKTASRALSVLGGRLKGIEKFRFSWGERSLVLVQKVVKTPRLYPRKAGTAAKQPL